MKEKQYLDQYAVFGHPVAHSLSPTIHGLFSQQTGQLLEYRAIDPGGNGFNAGIQRFSDSGGLGANITLPFKLDAAQWVDRQTERARRAAAVNTLIRQTDGSWLGDNTDGAGLVRDLIVRLKRPLKGCKILILGAGGATQGILGPLLDESPGVCLVANRTAHKAVTLANAFGSACRACGLDELATKGPFDLIVHTTSSGHTGQSLALDGSLISPATGCYDISYGKAAQPFLSWASAHNAAWISDGLGMLIEQAAESFWLWRGQRPNTASVYKELAL